MRLFIAAILPEEIKLKMGGYIDALRPNVGGVKWEPRDKLHLTLKFLGNTEKSTSSKVADIVQTLSAEYSPFDFTTTSLGGFPDLKRPRLLYLGLSQNEELALLKNSIDKSLSELGFKSDNRRFLPHVTIGRIKNRFNLKGPVPIPQRLSFTISKIGIIKSELTPGGSVYTPLKVFDLTD